MPNFGVLPNGTVLFAPGTITSTTTSGVVALPPASSYRIIAQVATVSGTSPTMVVAILTSFDAGATYNQVITTSTITTTGQGQQLMIRPYLGIGDAATNAATSLDGTASLAAATVNNGPLNPQFIKIKCTIAGTSPSFGTVNIGAIIVPQDMSD